MFPGILWRFSWTLHLKRYCKLSPTSQYFFSADDKNELDEELWCSFGKSAMIEGKSNSKIAFSWQRGCLTLTASEVAFFYPPWSHMQEKQALHFHNLPFPQFFPPFLSNNRWQLSSTQLAELNYLGRPKLVLGSAHVKFDVWTWPKRIKKRLKINLRCTP